MQSRAARLILLCLFLLAITTATFLFWKGDSEAAAAALEARTFDASARAIERGLLDVRRRSWRTPRLVSLATAG